MIISTIEDPGPRGLDMRGQNLFKSKQIMPLEMLYINYVILFYVTSCNFEPLVIIIGIVSPTKRQMINNKISISQH